MVSLIIALVALIAAGAVVKYMVGKHESKLDVIFKRLDKHGDDIVTMKAEAFHNLTAEKADALYLRLSEFARFEKHSDARFDEMGKSLDDNSDLLKQVLIKLEPKK